MKRLAMALVLLASTLDYAGERVVYSFQGGTDGALPDVGLIADRFGNLYGTTKYGGGGPCVTSRIILGCGTIFELSPDGKGNWNEAVLYAFTGGTDGLFPTPALVLDGAGNLFGTSLGGVPSANIQCPPSCGSAFELSPGVQGWTLTVLHAFKGGNDGGTLLGGLVADASGNLYGATNIGGHSTFGTFFQLAPVNGKWTLKTLHSFKDIQAGPDGGQPNGTPLLGVDGKLYGTTANGGTYGGGTIYRFVQTNTGKWNEKIVHSYGSSSKDRGAQFGDLAQDKLGNLYGVGVGVDGGFYYAYRMSLIKGVWRRRNIHLFARSRGDGATPNNYLMVDTVGNVYGTVPSGPDVPFGKAYKLSEQNGNWSETVLYVFKGAPDGDGPDSKLLLDRSGNLWGTTASGGTNTNCSGYVCGTVFEITP